MLDRESGQPDQRGHAPIPHELQRPAHLELFDVLGEVAAGHALVHVLVAREVVELLDPCLDIVPQHAFPLGDAREVDVLDDRLVRIDRSISSRDAEVSLSLQDSEPELPLQDDLVLG